MLATGWRNAHLLRALDFHIRNIQGTLQILEKSNATSSEKVEWLQVMKLADEISKQATVAGMLWSGEPEIKQLEENMESYFNVLHGFILLCHGSTAGAGPTLHASICASARQVVDSSLALFKEAASNESGDSSKRLSIPQLCGSVWDACANLKKTPTSNLTAIGRAISHVAVLVKDVLLEMNELKPTASTTLTNPSIEVDDSVDEDFGDDLSSEEMLIAQLATKAISNVLVALKEVIQFASCLHKLSNDERIAHVDTLERLLSCCRDIGDQVNELGASLYPPQEISVLKSTTKKIYTMVKEMQKDVEMIAGSHENILACFEALESSLKAMESRLCGIVFSDMERLAL